MGDGHERQLQCGRVADAAATGHHRELAADLAARRLAPLDDLPASTRARLLETLAAWLDAHGEARAAAAALHVHVQTVRYPLGQLRDLLGTALDDPDARLELALALRVAR